MSAGGEGRRRINRGTLILVALMAGLIAFVAAAQMRQESDALSGLRQADLVRLLDEQTRRLDELESERSDLRDELTALESGVTSHTEALRAADARIQSLSIQAGVIPVHGPGIELTVDDPERSLRAQSLVSLVEELRNAGAEAIEINDARLGASSWFVDDGDAISIDGVTTRPPYTVRAIGDPDAIGVALDMPGGVLAAFRNAGATTSLSDSDDVEIRSVRTLPELQHAEVVE